VGSSTFCPVFRVEENPVGSSFAGSVLERLGILDSAILGISTGKRDTLGNGSGFFATSIFAGLFTTGNDGAGAGVVATLGNAMKVGCGFSATATENGSGGTTVATCGKLTGVGTSGCGCVNNGG